MYVICIYIYILSVCDVMWCDVMYRNVMSCRVVWCYGILYIGLIDCWTGVSNYHVRFTTIAVRLLECTSLMFAASIYGKHIHMRRSFIMYCNCICGVWLRSMDIHNTRQSDLSLSLSPCVCVFPFLFLSLFLSLSLSLLKVQHRSTLFIHHIRGFCRLSAPHALSHLYTTYNYNVPKGNSSASPHPSWALNMEDMEGNYQKPTTEHEFLLAGTSS